MVGQGIWPCRIGYARKSSLVFACNSRLWFLPPAQSRSQKVPESKSRGTEKWKDQEPTAKVADFRGRHFLNFRARQLRIVRVPTFDRLVLRFIRREEFEKTVLTVVTGLLEVPERHKFKFMAGELGGHVFVDIAQKPSAKFPLYSNRLWLLPKLFALFRADREARAANLALLVSANIERASDALPLGHNRSDCGRAHPLLRLSMVVAIKDAELRLESVIEMTLRHLHRFLTVTLKPLYSKLYKCISFLAVAAGVNVSRFLMSGKSIGSFPVRLGQAEHTLADGKRFESVVSKGAVERSR